MISPRTKTSSARVPVSLIDRAELAVRCGCRGEREVCVAEDAKCPCGKMLGTVFVSTAQLAR